MIKSIYKPILNLNPTKVFEFLRSIEKLDSTAQKPDNHSKNPYNLCVFIFSFKFFILLVSSTLALKGKTIANKLK